MSSSSKSKKCSVCARRGQKCEKQLHSDMEWDKLKKAKTDLEAQLLVERAMFAEYSRKMTESLAKMNRLEKHHKFLNERGEKMLEHDSSIFDRWDEEDPFNADDLVELERLAEAHEAQHSKAVPSSSVVLPDISWSQFDDLIVGTGSPPVIAGSSSSS